MAVARQTRVRIDQQALLRKIERALTSPQARGHLTRVANAESRKIKAFAEEIAEEELHRRPDDRRTAESLAHGKEYHDSFEIIPADSSNPSKVRAGITNTHPAAAIIENGSDGHPIEARSAKRLIFPSGGAAGGIVPVPGKHSNFRQGQKGTFPVEITPENKTTAIIVNHPGTAPRRILARAADRYRKSTRHNVKVKSTQ